MRDGEVPAGALAHVPCCDTKGDSIRVGLKDGGKRERAPPFFFPVDRRTGIATPDGPKWTAQSDDLWRVLGGSEVVKGYDYFYSRRSEMDGPRAMPSLEGVWEGGRGKHS